MVKKVMIAGLVTLSILAVFGCILLFFLPDLQREREPKIRDAWVSSMVDCPSSPDYGKLIVRQARVYDKDGTATNNFIPHGEQVEILTEVDSSTGMYKVRYKSATGYVQSFMVSDYDPASGVKPKPEDCVP